MYFAFLASALAWLPVAIWWHPHTDPGSTWRVWLPCAIIFAPLQAMSALEAVYRFGEKYRSVVGLAVGTGFFAIAAAVYFWLHHRVTGGIQQQVTDFATYQRLFTSVFLILSLAMFQTFVDWEEFLTRREGRHLVLLTLLTLTWTVPAVVPRGDGGWWKVMDLWAVALRYGFTGTWVLVIPAWRIPSLLRRRQSVPADVAQSA